MSLFWSMVGVGLIGYFLHGWRRAARFSKVLKLAEACRQMDASLRECGWVAESFTERDATWRNHSDFVLTVAAK